MLIVSAKPRSIRLVAESICFYAGEGCKVADVLAAPWRIDVFIGSQSDVATYSYVAMRSRVVYIVVEGVYKLPLGVGLVKRVCQMSRCVASTKWGRSLLESQGIAVQDVAYHPLPPVSRELVEYLRSAQRTFEVEYLNAKYVLGPHAYCERKGWRFWREISSEFRSIGFLTSWGLPAERSAEGMIAYRAENVSEVYKLLSVASVYANLSTNEGFGLNPIMALNVGTKVVSWNAPAVSETLRGIDGVFFVPAENAGKCLVGYSSGLAEVETRWGNIDEFKRAVRQALNSTVGVDYAEVESRFGPHAIRPLIE